MNGTGVTVRPMAAGEATQWLAMRFALWPETDRAEIEADTAEFVRGGTHLKTVLFAIHEDEPAGFIEISERSVAEGCWDAPCAYIEGWWVAAPLRGTGVGRALVETAVVWSRDQGYACLASDAELENTASQKAHAALGFTEMVRTVHFAMRLDE